MHDFHSHILIPIISLGLIIFLTCVNLRYFLANRKQYKVIKKEKARMALNLKKLAAHELPADSLIKLNTVPIEKLQLMKKEAVTKEILFQHWPSDN